MSPVIIILAFFYQINVITGDTYDNGYLPKIIPVLPAVSKVCNYDAFVASTKFNNKVFLFPWETDNQRGNWLKAWGYCAAHCAEMVTIHSEEENKFFLDFMRNVGFDDKGENGNKVSIWLGAQVHNKTFTNWSNGEKGDFNPAAIGEYNEDGLTCLTAAFKITNDFWYNYFCDRNSNFIACQRSADLVVGRK